jgi:hypothetical protein
MIIRFDRFDRRIPNRLQRCGAFEHQCSQLHFGSLNVYVSLSALPGFDRSTNYHGFKLPDSDHCAQQLAFTLNCQKETRVL